MHETTPLKEETLREPLRNPYGTLQALQPQKTLKLSCTKHPEKPSASLIKSSSNAIRKHLDNLRSKALNPKPSCRN